MLALLFCLVILLAVVSKDTPFDLGGRSGSGTESSLALLSPRNSFVLFKAKPRALKGQCGRKLFLCGCVVKLYLGVKQLLLKASHLPLSPPLPTSSCARPLLGPETPALQCGPSPCTSSPSRALTPEMGIPLSLQFLGNREGRQVWYIFLQTYNLLTSGWALVLNVYSPATTSPSLGNLILEMPIPSPPPPTHTC